MVTVRRIVLVVTIAATGIFVATFLQGGYVAPSAETSLPETVEMPLSVPSKAPSRIRIPSLEVDAHVAQVGIARSGNMAVPLRYEDAGWYRLGTVPGHRGSAVINGHLDNGFGLPAVFARIGELAPGDLIYIDTADGEEVRFVVEEVATYALADVPREILFNRADTARLNLITCSGAWLADDATYDHRVVVYAKLAP